MGETLPTVVILGHSFVSRISADFATGVFPPNYDLRQCTVLHSGLAGLSVCKNSEFDNNGESKFINFTTQFKSRFGNFLRRHRPSIVLIQLGENDIDSNTDSLTIANTIEEIAVVLVGEFDVSVVFVCELFPRNITRILPALYEKKRAHTNTILQTLLEVHQNNVIRFWRHRRIFKAESDIFTADGVNLSSFGQQRFYRSIRHAIMTALQSLQSQ